MKKAANWGGLYHFKPNVRCLLLCRFLGRRDKDAIHTLGQPAFEKRQGTKSREGIRVAMRRALSRTEHRT
jgi:hypothetical protein